MPNDGIDLTGTLLVRKRVGSPLKKTVTEYDQTENPLHFFPAPSIREIGKLKVTCDGISKPMLAAPLETHVNLNHGDAFYVGLGNTRSDLFEFAARDSNGNVQNRLLLAFPKKYPLRTA